MVRQKLGEKLVTSAQVGQAAVAQSLRRRSLENKAGGPGFIRSLGFGLGSKVAPAKPQQSEAGSGGGGGGLGDEGHSDGSDDADDADEALRDGATAEGSAAYEDERGSRAAEVKRPTPQASPAYRGSGGGAAAGGRISITAENAAAAAALAALPRLNLRTGKGGGPMAKFAQATTEEDWRNYGGPFLIEC